MPMLIHAACRDEPPIRFRCAMMLAVDLFALRRRFSCHDTLPLKYHDGAADAPLDVIIFALSVAADI